MKKKLNYEIKIEMVVSVVAFFSIILSPDTKIVRISFYLLHKLKKKKKIRIVYT